METTKCKEIRSPAKKKLKLSLSSARASTSNARFAEPLPDERMKEISKGKRSVSTLRSTSWAVTVYREWISNRNLHSTDKCPEDFLELQHPEMLYVWKNGCVCLLWRQESKMEIATHLVQFKVYHPVF